MGCRKRAGAQREQVRFVVAGNVRIWLCFRTAWLSFEITCPGIPKSHAGMETRGRFTNQDRFSSMGKSSIVFFTAAALMIQIYRPVMIAVFDAESCIRLVATWNHVHAAAVRQFLAIASMRMISLGGLPKTVQRTTLGSCNRNEHASGWTSLRDVR